MSSQVSTGHVRKAFSTLLATGLIFPPLLALADQPTGVIGNRVWNDTNQNGIQDVGEPGIEGVVVHLELSGNPGVVLAEDTTDSEGSYLFENQIPGNYALYFVPPAGFVSTHRRSENSPEADSDPDPETNRTDSIEISEEETDLTVDAGFCRPGTLGNLVFLDHNTNGIFDLEDHPLSGVRVQLWLEAALAYEEVPVGPDGILGTPDDALGGMLTNSSGHYRFTGLPSGTYRVQIPSAEFQPANPLCGLIGTVNPIVAPDADDDADQNIIAGSNPMEDGIWTAPVELVLAGSPLGETGDGAVGHAQNEHWDAFTDLTVDLGLRSPMDSIYATPQPLPAAIMGTGFSAWVGADYLGYLPYEFMVTSGGLPSGIVLNTVTGELSGIPKGPPETRAVEISAVDSAGHAKSIFLDFVVECPPVTIFYPSAPLAFGEPFGIEPVLSGSIPNPEGPAPSWSLTAGALPLGLSLNLDTGEISGVPTLGGRFQAEITFTDGWGCSASVALELNVPVARISGQIMADTDGDNLGNERLTDSVTLLLLDGLGAPVDDPNQAEVQDYVIQTTTGNYDFRNIAPGSYIVRQIQPVGWISANDYDATEDADGSPDDDPNWSWVDNEVQANVADGETDSGNTFVEFRAGVITGRVMMDVDDDGQGDVGIPAVPVRLISVDSEEFVETQTDENGEYVFTNLKPNTPYEIRKLNQEDSGRPPTLDLLQADFEPDRADSPPDDVLEEYPVFRIQLARSETDSGNHFLEVLPSSIRGVVRRNNTEDGSVSVPEPFVFLELLHDPNANGLPDDASSVYRYNRGESEAYVVMTDENGFYDFDNLLPGSYLVRLLAPDAHAVVGGSDSTEDNPLLPQDPANAHHNDGLIAVRLASGEMDDGNSFRIVLEATVRGGVLLDEDDNGIGDSPMAEVLLELRTLADGPVDDPNQPGFQRYVTQTSSLQGIFEFTKLIPGAYRVFQLQPQGFTSTADEDTSADSPTSPEDAPNTDPRDNIIPTHLAVGETDDGHWFVEERVVGMAVGNLVFSDINGDGVYNPSGEDQNFASLYDNDTGLPGVQVQLWRSVDDIFGNEDDVRIKTGADGVEGTADDLTSATETDPAGRYLFSGLMTQGRYYVKIPATELGEGLLGKVSSPGQQLDQTQDDDAGENGNDDPTNGFISSMFDLTFNAMPSGETGKPSPQPDDNSTNLTIDFGFFGPAGITGRVWNDLDNNNTPDDPIGGVVLTLLNQFREPVRNPNLPDFQAYEVTTDEDGRYTFTNLPPARYLVVQKQPDGYLSISAEDVTEDLLTSPPDMTDQDSGYDEIAVTLAPSETDSGNDFTEELGVSISGKVEFDGEGDGSPDQAMVGALIYVTDAQGTQIYNHQGESTEPVSAVSREDGTYDMPLLAPGIYGLRLVPQQFQVGLTDSDGGDPLRYTPRMFSNFSDNTGINFVLTKALAIGNLVFIDLDTDGKYTAGSDHPVAEITVLCFRDENEDGVLTGPQEQTPISLAQTNENGRYLIDNLRAGHYILQIPPGAFSTGSLASLRPAPIAENSGGSDDETSHDALPAESPELTGVYTRPIALTVGAAPLDEATDDGQGQDALRDSDVDLTVDFAFVGSLAIYGFVYQDADQSGDYSSGDDALAASQINLWLDSNNNFTLDSLDYQIGSRFTDALGSYGFESLMPGRYFVQSATLPGATRITNSQGNTGVVSVQLARESSYDNWFLDRIVPTGHLYSSRTGAIIPGGRVYSRNQSGNSHLDGNSGRYFMSPTQGSTEMTLFIVPPPGWKVDPNGWAGESPFQAPAVSGGHVLGSAESTTTPGFLNSLEQQNPYYESFIITEGPQPYGYNAVVYNNIPLVEIIPSTFAEWLHQRGSSSEEAYDDFNRNGFNNILEFAFGLPADSQVIPHAPIRINADPHTGKVLVCHLALQQSEGVQYFLEVSQDLFKNPVWHRIETLTPSAIYNPDGTQYVCYSGIEDVFAWLAEGRGFVRVVVGVDMDLDGSIDFTTASSVSGWQSHSHAVAASPEVTSQTTTFANPFIKFTAWQGSLTGANPTQIFTQGKVDGAMRTDSCYVLEILNGPLGGHRFGLDPVGSADTTLRLVPGSPFTTTVPLDGLLGGADAVIRELWRINDVLPPTRFMADGDPDAGDNALLFENGQWRSFYAVSTNEGTVWADATTALPTDSGANKYLDPAQALFVVRRGGALSTVIAGQVRTTPFAMPLKLGYNLVGAVFPGVQTISDRGMDNTDVFRGHAESTRADQILLWRGDFAPGKNGYQSYFFLDLEQPFQFWTGISDVHLHSVNYDELFGPTSAAFYLSRREHSDWIIRPPRGRGGEQ